MGIIDTLPIEDTVQRYDFWLELRGARWRRRKDLRRELRANLRAAAADVGTRRALLNLGTPKQLAHEATDGEFQRRPQWSRAVGASGVGWPVLGLPLVVFLLTARPWRLLTGRRAAQVREPAL